MIQNHAFRALLGDKDFARVEKNLTERVTRMIRHRLELLGARCYLIHDDTLGPIFEIVIRVQGLDRWRIKQHAREIGTFLLASQGLKFDKPLQPFLVETEGNRRGLKLEEGRVPRARPRAGLGSRLSTRTASE